MPNIERPQAMCRRRKFSLPVSSNFCREGIGPVTYGAIARRTSKYEFGRLPPFLGKAAEELQGFDVGSWGPV